MHFEVNTGDILLVLPSLLYKAIVPAVVPSSFVLNTEVLILMRPYCPGKERDYVPCSNPPCTVPVLVPNIIIHNSYSNDVFFSLLEEKSLDIISPSTHLKLVVRIILSISNVFKLYFDMRFHTLHSRLAILGGMTAWEQAKDVASGGCSGGQ